jgi:hypothetical protein
MAPDISCGVPVIFALLHKVVFISSRIQRNHHAWCRKAPRPRVAVKVLDLKAPCAGTVDSMAS